ncbi:MAG TPA: tyrosine--tRNA ligase [Patescibacteria group bacterium]|nr:tyrosine--tRNA ligase [Patescibacteria group bacterium]
MNKIQLSEELKWRGFINQTTFEDMEDLNKQSWVFYHGFDASAPSQTIGNLAAMMFDKVFMRHGHKAILLAGGSTSLIGDPGGKDAERPLQSEETIANNIAQAEKQLKKVFDGQQFTLVNNLDWTKGLKVLDFLRDIGKHFSMTPLVQRDYIAKRLGEGGAGMSYAEFSYTLLQGLDYLYLYDNYGVTLQLGGADQWGNCLSGVELIRKARSKEVHAITLPLIINGATGKKFGKSEDGSIWLDESLTSVYQFYQFWLNVDDKGVENYLKVYTELDKDEIDAVMVDFNNDRASRVAQKTLAYEVTKIVHGEDQAIKHQHMIEVLFGNRSYNELSETELTEFWEETGKHIVKLATELAEVLVQTNLAASKTEARRFIEDNAIYINGLQIPLSKTTLDNDDAINGYVVLRRGKNSQVVIKIS